MKELKAKIISNERMAEGRFRIRLEAPSIARAAKPGQFVMVKCTEALDPLLRRPLSFHRIEKRYFELLYQVIGRGTEALSQRRPGERLDIIGPLGNGFDILSAKRYPLNAILVAGGIGVAPLLALAEKVKSKKEKGKTFKEKVKVLIGARTKSHILCVDDFKRIGIDVEIATEDGSRGYKGLVTDLLTGHCEGAKRPKQSRRLLRRAFPFRGGFALGAPRNDSACTVIYACGPRGMLKETAAIAKKNGVACQVSLEENMACGTGVCLGCGVKTVTGFRMVCKDGPVFNAGEIIW